MQRAMKEAEKEEEEQQQQQKRQRVATAGQPSSSASEATKEHQGNDDEDGVKQKLVLWLDRDARITDAVRAHEAWFQATGKTCNDLVAKCAATMAASSDPSLAVYVGSDRSTLNNRLHCLKLVVGGAASVSTCAMASKAY